MMAQAHLLPAGALLSSSFMLETAHFLGEDADVPAVSMGPAVSVFAPSSAPSFSTALLPAHQQPSAPRLGTWLGSGWSWC